MQLKQVATVPIRQASRRRVKPAWYMSLGALLVSDRARFVALACFMLLVAATGGSSRADVPSLVLLRPAAVLFCAYALFTVTAGQLREARAPLLAVLALMLLALLQLVPLPAGIWTDLPHREVMAQASDLVGMNGQSRPLSLDPNRTWNTFFALFVPLAAIGLAAIQAQARRRLIVPLLMAVGLLSAILGFLQAIGGGLQFYDISHRGFPTGLFANKNHQSMLLLWLMLAGSWLATTADPRHHSVRAVSGGALALILVLFPLLVLTGSRAGLLLSLPALLLCGWLLLRASATKDILRRAGRRAKIVVGLAIAVMVAPLVFVFGVLALSGRRTALSYLFEANVTEDLRWQYLSLFWRMILDYLPFGSGFGSFENTFNMYEPAGMLTTRYMNQAHNDLVQLLIEGGLPALAILLAALVWVARSGWRLWRSPQRDGRADAAFFAGSIALWLAASLVDYPLRTPLAAMLVAALTAQLGFRSTELRSGRGGQAKESMQTGAQ